MTGALELRNLCIRRADTTLVHLSAVVPAGQVLSIMGPSGCGKSTLLSAIIGALPPEFTCTGQVLLDGVDITQTPTPARKLGLLFQDDILFPHLSVGGNLGFALPRSIRGTARIERINAALTEAGLGGMANRDPATLSGGQRARVSLMRTLLAEPRALLLDEPFSRLDAERRARIRTFVFQRAAERGLPVVLVTHDIDDARAANGPILGVTGRPIDGAP
jgi:putative thiamine transport system ATP-binding protein